MENKELIKLTHQYYNDKHNCWFDCSEEDAIMAKSIGLNIKNKEQNTGMSLEDAAKNAYKKYSLKDDEFSLNEQIQRVGGFITGFKAGASWQSSQPINSGWVSVEDRLPDDDQTVLVTNGQRVKEVCFAQRTKLDMPNFRFTTMKFDEITHWMPLPSPPKQ